LVSFESRKAAGCRNTAWEFSRDGCNLSRILS
jgi:hypothetical protein